MRRRIGGLLEDPHHAVVADLSDPEPLGVGHLLQKDARATAVLLKPSDLGAEVALEHVVAQNDADGTVRGEGFRPRQCVRDAPLAFLVGVVEPPRPYLSAVTEQLHEPPAVVSARDDEDLVDPGADQRLHGVEDHRPVVDREQVLVRDRRHGEEPRPQTTRQDDALHRPRSRSPRSSRPRISSGLTATAWAASSSKSSASNVSVSSSSGERAALSGKKATRPRHTPSACRRATSVTIHRLLPCEDRKSTRLNSSHLVISYAVFCLKKKKETKTQCTRI